jgi:hypothetical protein
MRVLRTLAILFAGSSLLPIATLAAVKTNKKTMHLYEDAKVKGTLLRSGDYKVEWSGPGPNVRLNIVQNGTTVATAPARVVTENTPHDHDGYILKSAKNGGKSIEEFFFSGKKYDLKINPSGNAS